MQPYIFPKLSYWKLINCVDTFVISDDAQYTKGGWINKNRLLINKEIKNFSIPIKQDGHEKRINERFLAENWSRQKQKLLFLIKENYKNTNNFAEIYFLIKKIFDYENVSLSDFLVNSIIEINKYLNIDTKIIKSSSLNMSKEYKKEKKIIEICNVLSKKKYINAIGGQKIYNKDEFKKYDIELLFLNSNKRIINESFTTVNTDLSILHVMMYVDKETLLKELKNYELI